jgi:hypothetical protein
MRNILSGSLATVTWIALLSLVVAGITRASVYAKERRLHEAAIARSDAKFKLFSTRGSG